ncbi:MAG: hypothetical protein HY922_07045 [Elusimicrobia bacterium]|nr:hypothetical protein [Elusimicrobiota bacterium]
MGRIRQFVEARGKRYWTLFDSGSRNTYVTVEVARRFPRVRLDKTFDVRLGGKTHKLKEGLLLKARIENRPIDTDAYVINRIGKDEQGRDIQVLFGALAMQKWGIRLDPQRERLDMTRYPKEFLEF